jgi:putative ABC transport system ATP-binding protein
MDAIQTRDVTKIYGSGASAVIAVRDVTIALESGQFVALVGPSGSGKTSLLAMLAGLLRPNEGQIIIDGRNIERMNENERTRFRREKIGFTFQANNLVPYLTALENVELMLRINNRMDTAGKARAKDLLVRLGLEGRLNNLPRKLSGGEQQRVAIARALIHEPSAVLADEPTASLDTERAHQVVEIFAHLIKENERAGLMVTHDLRMCRYVDKVIQMVDGRIARIISDPAEILKLAQSSREVDGEDTKRGCPKRGGGDFPARGIWGCPPN